MKNAHTLMIERKERAEQNRAFAAKRGDMPTHPTQGLDAQGLPLQEMDCGMTIREKFFLIAMQGVLANPKLTDKLSCENDFDFAVFNASKMATKMMEKLNEK